MKSEKSGISVTAEGATAQELAAILAAVEALWPKLCRSYFTDVIVPFPQARREHRQGHPDIRGYLNQLRSAQFRDRGTPGLGRNWQMVRGMSGSVLEWQGSIVHTSSFGR